MRKIARPPHSTPKLSRTQSLRLSRETIRTLTTGELPLAAGGCPTRIVAIGCGESDGEHGGWRQVPGGVASERGRRRKSAACA